MWQNSHEPFMIMYFNILPFVIPLSSFNTFLFEQQLDTGISQNICRGITLIHRSPSRPSHWTGQL